MHYVHGREDTDFGSRNQVETGTHTSAIRGYLMQMHQGLCIQSWCLEGLESSLTEVSCAVLLERSPSQWAFGSGPRFHAATMS